MKKHLHLCLAVMTASLSWAAQTVSTPIDFERARALLERQRSGETLSADDRAYLERAQTERRNAQRPSSKTGRPAPEGSAGRQRPPTANLIPLTDLGGTGRYEDQDGGLYGGGHNTPPPAHRQAAEQQLALIRPLNSAGAAASDGIIGFVSLSMSNATQEFSHFKRIADASPLKSPHVTIVDCAQGGQAMAEWASPDAPAWQTARTRLATAGVSPAQVQVIWVKLANKSPAGSLQQHGRKLEQDTLALLRNARALFPNLRIAYLGSRTYGGYAAGNLNPEPYAYESAFAARWLIQRQMSGEADLAPPNVPLLLWGPYLWADGLRGRKGDSLIWAREDFLADGVHPSDSGRQKVAELLLGFFSRDPLARSWFSPAK